MGGLQAKIGPSSQHHKTSALLSDFEVKMEQRGLGDPKMAGMTASPPLPYTIMTYQILGLFYGMVQS